MFRVPKNQTGQSSFAAGRLAVLARFSMAMEASDPGGVNNTGASIISLVAEWIHFTLFVVILPTIKLKVYAFWGL